MNFDLSTWKQQTDLKLQGISALIARARQRYAPNLLYGALCGMSLWPLVEAARGGQTLDVMMALGSVAAGVGGNLLAEQMQRWQDHADQAELAEWVVEHAPTNADLREALDEILARLAVVSQAQAGLGEADRAWFAQTLQRELGQVGNLERFQAQLTGSGAIAQNGSVAAGAGGVAVKGDVHGDVVLGSKIVGVDQRGQKGDQQINVASGWKNKGVAE